MNELKPCPFCGGRHIESRVCDYGEKRTGTKPHLVGCMKCRIYVSATPTEADIEGFKNRKEAAEKKWNTRPDNWIKFETDEIDGVSKITNPIPDDEQRVLVTNGIDVWEDIFLNDGECYFDSGFEIFDTITHWQPLPTPPAKEEQS